eukprot:scaffold9305_cov91-Isochrysis_galbana.AAC.3
MPPPVSFRPTPPARPPLSVPAAAFNSPAAPPVMVGPPPPAERRPEPSNARKHSSSSVTRAQAGSGCTSGLPPASRHQARAARPAARQTNSASSPPPVSKREPYLPPMAKAESKSDNTATSGRPAAVQSSSWAVALCLGSFRGAAQAAAASDGRGTPGAVLALAGGTDSRSELRVGDRGGVRISVGGGGEEAGGSTGGEARHRGRPHLDRPRHSPRRLMHRLPHADMHPTIGAVPQGPMRTLRPPTRLAARWLVQEENSRPAGRRRLDGAHRPYLQQRGHPSSPQRFEPQVGFERSNAGGEWGKRRRACPVLRRAAGRCVLRRRRDLGAVEGVDVVEEAAGADLSPRLASKKCKGGSSRQVRQNGCCPNLCIPPAFARGAGGVALAELDRERGERLHRRQEGHGGGDGRVGARRVTVEKGGSGPSVAGGARARPTRSAHPAGGTCLPPGTSGNRPRLALGTSIGGAAGPQCGRARPTWPPSRSRRYPPGSTPGPRARPARAPATRRRGASGRNAAPRSRAGSRPTGGAESGARPARADQRTVRQTLPARARPSMEPPPAGAPGPHERALPAAGPARRRAASSSRPDPPC